MKSNTSKNKKLRDATLVFLVKKNEGRVHKICLAMKKKGFGINRWNGSGGKVEKGEKIDFATKREAKEEIGVEIVEMNKVAELSFYFPHNPDWDQKVHVYFSENWNGDPSESEELRPEWFYLHELPYDFMWPDDKFWLPHVLEDTLIRASFIFGDGDIIKEKDIRIIESF
jgi:8-oxo-dGTP pyrophosphatase MutT (NUDIX family)